jgi:hypothetical protein
MYGKLVQYWSTVLDIRTSVGPSCISTPHEWGRRAACKRFDTRSLQSERLCLLWVAPHATSQPSHPSDRIFFSDSVGPSLFSYITSHRITTGFSGGSSRRLCVVSLSLTLLLHTHTQSVSLVSHLFVGCSRSWFICIFHPSRRSHFVHLQPTYHPSARSRVSL